MQFLQNIDLVQNELRNAVLQPLATPPQNPKEGQFYYNSTSKLMSQWNGTEWIVYGETGGETVDWNDVLNKPAGLVVDDNYVHTDNNFTDGDQSKLAGIESGAEVNANGFGTIGTIPATTDSDALIINGSGIVSVIPNAAQKTLTIGAVVPAEYVTDTEMQEYAQPIGDYATNEELTQGLATKLNLSGGTMAGALNMGNFPINNIPAATGDNQPATYKQLQDAIAGIGTVFDLKGSVASYSQLPQVGNTIGDVWYVEDESVGYVWLEDSSGTLRWEQLGQTVDTSLFVTKADLLTTTGGETDNTMSQAAITTALAEKANTADLAEVAISGLYSDLTGAPTIPKAVSVATSTISPSATSTTVTVTGNIVGVMIFDNVTKAQVMCDSSFTGGTLNSRQTVVVSVASAPTNQLNVIVLYIAA